MLEAALQGLSQGNSEGRWLDRLRESAGGRGEGRRVEARAFLRRAYPTGKHRAGLWPGLRVQPLC